MDPSASQGASAIALRACPWLLVVGLLAFAWAPPRDARAGPPARHGQALLVTLGDARVDEAGVVSLVHGARAYTLAGELPGVVDGDGLTVAGRRDEGTGRLVVDEAWVHPDRARKKSLGVAGALITLALGAGLFRPSALGLRLRRG